VDGTALDAHVARKYDVVVEGTVLLPSPLRGRGAGREGADPADSWLARGVVVLCQDLLDYEAALQCNRRCRDAKMAFLWVSYGPMNRAYVSPLFLPDA